MTRISTILPLLLVTGCQHSTPLAGGSPAPGAPPSAPPLPSAPASTTKEDFADLSGLSFVVTGGFAGITDMLNIAEDHITQTKTRPPTTQFAAFTKEDMKQLAAVLAKANFAGIVGDYHQKNLADGFNERVTAVVGTGRGARVYVVSNYGDQAPAAYYKVTAYLRELQKTKLASAK